MFEILEIQKIVESKAKITLIPEGGGFLPELLHPNWRCTRCSTCQMIGCWLNHLGWGTLIAIHSRAESKSSAKLCALCGSRV